MIICLGLPKSGTLSLTEAFNSAGYKAAHWADDDGPFAFRVLHDIVVNKPILSSLIDEGYNAFMQLDYCKGSICFFPQVSLYDVLYRQYPDAHFILTYRPVKNHVRSMLAWGDYADRLAYFGINNLEKFINDHNDNICDFFENKGDNFYWFNIEDDTQENLSKFIGREIKIPHLNKTNYAHA